VSSMKCVVILAVKMKIIQAFFQGAEIHTGRNTLGETQAFTLKKEKKIVCKYEQMDSYVMMRGLMRISLI